MRLGVFGGSFDPVHLGHLLVAESCREACELDEVWFVPAARSPHKLDRALAADEHRLEMLRRAIDGRAGLVVSDYELVRGGVSYTVDTLETLRRERPTAELFLLLGSDSLRDFPLWRAPERIAELATLAVAQRGGRPSDESKEARRTLSEQVGVPVRCVEFAMPTIELSSSELRHRRAAGRSIRFRTPRGVEEYIDQVGLYRRAT